MTKLKKTKLTNKANVVDPQETQKMEEWVRMIKEMPDIRPERISAESSSIPLKDLAKKILEDLS